jgi:hypothetical protein
MAKNNYLTWVLGLAVALVLSWYFLWSAITPNGQPPLTRLTSEQQFVSQFDHAALGVRMVLLLSPT